MTRLIIVCEGPTEHEFCTGVLGPALLKHGVYVDAPLIKRSQGGIVSWSNIRSQIIRHLHEAGAYVSLLVDYYGIKDSFSFPGWKESQGIADKHERMRFLFERMSDDLPDELSSRFVPYIQLHEFECLIFSDLSVITQNFDAKEVNMEILERAVKEFANPEEINTRPDLAPSKRLMAAITGYNKIIYGYCLAYDIGLDRILERCPMFAEWYHTLSKINQR